MIINSDALKTRGGPQGLIHHLLGKPEENEHIRLVRGSDEMIRFAYDDARVHQSQRAVLHVKLSPDTQQELSASDWEQCLNQLAQEYHFAPQSVSIIEHQKKGRTHRHLVVPFVDAVTGRKLDLGFSKLRDEKCARLLELSLNHKLTPMKPGHRQSVVRFLASQGLAREADQIAQIPDAGLGTSRIAHQKVKREGRDLADDKACIKALYQQSDSPKAFQAALKDQGYLLQKGEKAGRFIISHQDGALIGSANRLLGQRVKAFQYYMENDHELIFKEKNNTKPEETHSPNAPHTSEANATHTASIRRKTSQQHARNDPSKQQSRPSIGRTSDVDERRRQRREPRPDPASAGHAQPARRARTQQRQAPNSHRDRLEALHAQLQKSPAPHAVLKACVQLQNAQKPRNFRSEELQRTLNKQRLKALHQQLKKPLSRSSRLTAHVRMRASLELSYDDRLLPSGVREPASRNTAYRVRLMLAYYRGQYEGAERLARVTSWVDVQKGFITVRLKNGDLFQDYGDQMTCQPGAVQPSTAREIVLSAKAKGWSAIEVAGSQDFKDSIALHAALNNIPCDHTLSSAGRERLQRVEAEMRRSEVIQTTALPDFGR